MANSTNLDSDTLDHLRLELRRGALTLAVLARLRAEQYGYTLGKALTDDGVAIDENTLYPLLRRLEAQGLLLSQWREENKRTKRFYRLSPLGETVLTQLIAEWQTLNTALNRIVMEH
jgi:PadR family transcriptional regulator PadR